jgi:hypothetical protein
MSSSGVSAMTATISTTTRRTAAWSVVQARAVAATQAATQSPATTAFTPSMRVMNVARNSVGSVTMSPIAVTIGVDTASRSYPRRNDSSDRPIVTSRITTEPSAPPTTEIVTRSHREIVCSPKAAATSFASSASHKDDANVVMTLTSTF